MNKPVSVTTHEDEEDEDVGVDNVKRVSNASLPLGKGGV